jgi:hypothetical protein
MSDRVDLPDLDEWEEAHVTPIADLIEHESSENCVCGPEIKPLKRSDGSIVYVYLHHALDGRKDSET